MIRQRVVVQGRVQGVFFRDTCMREASRRGLAGWVRNLPEGAVEAVFEGDEALVAEMVRWCGVGPPYAEVHRVDATTEPARGERGFDVRP